MNKAETLNQLQALGLVAVIRGPSSELTLQMVEALIAGGVCGIEITYSTPQAAQVVRTLSRKYGAQILLGMGTLITPDQAQEALAAGAHYVVSPHYEKKLAHAMVNTGLAVMIGALTPTEVMKSLSAGSDVVKLFPGSFAGPAYLKALRGPFPDIPIMPTGGVSAQNVAEWFALGVVAVGAGSELCPPALAKEGRFDEITQRAKDFVAAVERARS